MKILVHSNAPWAGTGYGQQTGMFAKLAKQAGHQVAISSFYGLHGALLSWEDMPVYPGGFDAYGNDVILGHANHFFQGEPGLILTLVDFWVIGAEQLTRADVAAWVPVDHDPVPPMVAERLEAAGATPIAMSRFGERMLTQAGLSPLYAPHAIDTDVFRPYQQAEARADLGIPQDRFVVGMVAANKGYPPRKSFSQAILAFKAFLNDHPGALLYLHTEPNGAIQGLNLNELCRTLELPPDNIAISDTYGSQILGWPAHMVAKLHSSFDALLAPSRGEGFGIPIVEAQACFPAGTPIEAEDPLVTWCKPYTGELVKITTGRGEFEATIDHPVWTDRGWQSVGSIRPGDRLLYCHAPEGTQEVFAGAIGDVVESLRDDAVERSSEALRHDLRSGILASASGTAGAQALLSEHRSSRPSTFPEAAGVLCGTDRRRRNSDDPSGTSRGRTATVISPLSNRGEHRQAAYRLANGNIQHSAQIRFEINTERINGLPVLARRIGLPSALRTVAAGVGSKGRSLGMGYRVDTSASFAIQDRPLDESSARDHLNDPRSEYETVSAVSRRSVENEPVYNLTTASSTYRVGPGYLVHNCGTPVIVTDHTAMTELCGAGWMVDGDLEFTDQRAFVKVPRIADIVDALDNAYRQRGSETLANQAREFALTYDQHTVWANHWEPVLAQLEPGLEMAA